MNNLKLLLSCAQAKMSVTAQAASISSSALPPWRPAPRVGGRMSRVGRRLRIQERREASLRPRPEPIHSPLTYGRRHVKSAAGVMRDDPRQSFVGANICAWPFTRCRLPRRSKFFLTSDTVAPRLVPALNFGIQGERTTLKGEL